MSVKYVDKSEWLEQTQKPNAVLIGAFLPSLSGATVQTDCSECGRPVYIRAYANGTAKTVCILCGLKLFSPADQVTLRKLLSRS
jgi:hypothetical protein